MSDRYAIIDNETKYIINIIMWDGVTTWEPPQNTTVKLFSSLTEEEMLFPPQRDETF